MYVACHFSEIKTIIIWWRADVVAVNIHMHVDYNSQLLPFNTVSVRMPGLCWLRFISGSHLEIIWLQKIISCGHTSSEYLWVSLKYMQSFMRYFANTTYKQTHENKITLSLSAAGENEQPFSLACFLFKKYGWNFWWRHFRPVKIELSNCIPKKQT